MQRRTIFCLLWLSGVMLCAVASSSAASDSAFNDLVTRIFDAGKAQDASSMKLLVESLCHESKIVRRAATWSLSQRPESASKHVAELASALTDQDAHVRCGAAHALGAIGRPAGKSEEALWKATLDRDVEARCAALIAIRTVSASSSHLGASAICESLLCSISDVQSEAIATASEFHPRWDDAEKRLLVTNLTKVLERSNDDLRLASAVLLGDLEMPATLAIPSLVQATDDANEFVQAAALRAVGQLVSKIDQRWSQLAETQRTELRTLCKLAEKNLATRQRESSEIAAIVEQLRHLDSGISPVSVEREWSSSMPKNQTAKNTPASPKSPSMARNVWLWIGMIVVAALAAIWIRRKWFVLSHLSSDVPDRPQMSDSAIAPAVVGNSATRKSPSRREAIDSLSDVMLDAAATLNQAMCDEDAVIRWRSASAVTAVHGATVPQLLAAVTSNDPEVRRLAVTSLRGLGANAIRPFVQALQDGDAGVRRAAAVTLGQIGPGSIDAVPQLTVALADVDSQVRACAAMALSVFGPHAMEAVPGLRCALSDVDAAVRARAAFALGQIGLPARRAAEDLIRLVSDPDVSVRLNGVSALGGIGADTAVVLPALRIALNDPDVGVRHCAAITRNLFDSASVTADFAKVRPVQFVAGLKVFRPDEEAIEPEVSSDQQRPLDTADLIAMLENIDPDACWNASQKLEQLGAVAVAEMIDSLNHRNPAVRKVLLAVLGRLGAGARSAAPAMLVALHDVNADVRCAAAESLGQLGVITRPMVQALMQSLNDSNAEVRRYAATTLGRFGQQAREATAALKIASISDIAVKVRTAAQAALQRISASLVGAA